VGRLDEDEVLAGAEVVQDADDHDVEALWLRPLEDGEAVALHPLVDLGHVDRPPPVGDVAARAGDERAETRERAEEDGREEQ
jgi:hypothetical protein